MRPARSARGRAILGRMETERLYLEDSKRLEFDAEVTEEIGLEDGSAIVRLDRTCFYPTSGGQPHDTGTLNDVRVLDVTEGEEEQIVHRVERPLGARHVHGRVDGGRRRDHMQQHSGQHLLSATCWSLFQRETLSFHLGAERCSVDLSGETLDRGTLAKLEQTTNEIVWEGRSVAARFVPIAEVEALRKAPPPGVEQVRVVEIEGWDRNACCGTHVHRTSEIGLVLLLAQERVGRGVRLHFVCGTRALAWLRQAQEREGDLVRLLTCHPDDLREKCERLVAENKALRKAIEAGVAQRAAREAEAWLSEAPRVGGVAWVARLVQGDEAELRAAADAVVARGGIALLGRRAERAHLLFARPETIDLDLRPVLAAASVGLGGRGGGPPARVQGSGPLVDALPAALETAERIVAESLASF